MTDRRGFLQCLAGLPLIDGGVRLIGQPTAAAVPVTDGLRWAYKEWLRMEHRMLSFEIARHDMQRTYAVERRCLNTPAGEWHLQWMDGIRRGPAGWIDAPQPSTRAAIVMSAVGCDWRST